MYKTTTVLLNPNQDNELIEYFSENCKKAKLLKNAVIFRCRQLLFARWKDFKNLNVNQMEVLNEFKQTENRFKPIGNKYYFPSYYHFDYMFKITNNPDYYSGLPSQTTQHVIKEALEDFKGYFSSLKKYKKDSTGYTGKPKIPKYIKTNEISFDITNQQALIKDFDSNKKYIQLPKTKLTLDLGSYNEFGELKEVTVKPFYDTYKICIVTEVEDPTPVKLDKNKIIGIDLGISNFLAVSNNCGLTPFVINGKIMKCFNQYYNKTLANLKSQLPDEQYTSKRLKRLFKYRQNYFNDKLHKISDYIIKYCLLNNIGTIVIGKNQQWKTSVNIGKINNQNFCSIPHNNFIKKLKEKAEIYGIKVIEREESYTSQASFLDNDDIPTYNKNNKTKYKFSGSREKRGLYISKNGIQINADINGASNIIRKAFPHAFDHITDFSYLYITTNRITV